MLSATASRGCVTPTRPVREQQSNRCGSSGEWGVDAAMDASLRASSPHDPPPRIAVKEFKLNAERNNGRAAMMGIVGMVIHEALTGNPLFPLPAPGA